MKGKREKGKGKRAGEKMVPSKKKKKGKNNKN